MTAKYTKRAYQKDLAANDAAMIENQAKLEEFNKRLEAGEDIAVLSDDWNAEHDKTWELEKERQSIEIRFRQRNWTWQDHSFANLVSQNID